MSFCLHRKTSREFFIIKELHKMWFIFLKSNVLFSSRFFHFPRICNQQTRFSKVQSISHFPGYTGYVDQRSGDFGRDKVLNSSNSEHGCSMPMHVFIYQCWTVVETMMNSIDCLNNVLQLRQPPCYSIVQALFQCCNNLYIFSGCKNCLID